jgi:phosphoribosylanthranilate isomerase
VTRVKYCGLTRAADAAVAGEIGASYVGAIFAGGPRAVQPAAARDVLAAAGAGVRRVGVFADQPPEVVAAVAREAQLDVVQLHADPTADTVDAVRRRYGGLVWAVLRPTGDDLPDRAPALFAVADAVLLDAQVPGALGGTGQTLPWAALRDAVDRARGAGTLVLAGGLTPTNVGAAIAALAPDVVDVSSGVEHEPGVKDHSRMRAFAEAVARAQELV